MKFRLLTTVCALAAVPVLMAGPAFAESNTTKHERLGDATRTYQAGEDSATESPVTGPTDIRRVDVQSWEHRSSVVVHVRDLREVRKTELRVRFHFEGNEGSWGTAAFEWSRGGGWFLFTTGDDDKIACDVNPHFHKRHDRLAFGIINDCFGNDEKWALTTRVRWAQQEGDRRVVLTDRAFVGMTKVA